MLQSVLIFLTVLTFYPPPQYRQLVPCFKEQKIDYKVKNLNKLNKRLVSTKSILHKYLQLF